MRHWLAALCLVVLSLGALAADGFVPIPRLAARVTDLTGTLTREQQVQLESTLVTIERDKGTQVVVLLLPSTQPESIEQFGIRLAESWKIGRRGVDDGVILLVAKNDRKVRIEVGYGLEGAISDAVSKRIVAEIVTPRFREGDFFGGLLEAVDALGKIIGGEALPAPEFSAASGQDEDSLFALLVFAAMAAPFARALLGLIGSVLAAGIAGYLAYALFSSWLAAGLAAVVALVFSFGRLGGSGGGWHSGGGGFSSSGSGGGFSGGGGSFGGGGASGSW